MNPKRLLGLSVSQRLYALMAIVAVGLAAVSVMSYRQISQDLVAQKREALSHLGESAVAVARSYHERANAAEMTQDAAKEAALAAIKAMRYAGKEYFWINDLSARVIMHPIKPELDGKDLSQFEDPTGKRIFVEFARVGKTDGSGFVDYMWPKPGSEEPVGKLSFVTAFKPWGWVVGTGVYVDDLEAVLAEEARNIAAAACLLQVVVFILGFLIVRSVRKPVNEMVTAMASLADGDMSVDVPALDRSDEVGRIARAVQVFKENTIKAKTLAEEQETARERRRAEEADAERRRADDLAAQERATRARGEAMEALAAAFQNEVADVLGAFAKASAIMTNTAESMSVIAERTSAQSETVSGASELATDNVRNVAAAAEQLSSSIREISAQVSHSAAVTANAVTEARHTNAKIEGLADAVQKIGDVVDLISDIASQTNLLALNATIEAARAGEAGKGFAVVASEVKSLADQTARATEDISTQISDIQAATGGAVTEIKRIGERIAEVNGIASAIAAAVEEQGASTQEIAQSVNQAARGTQQVSASIEEVARGATETGQSSRKVLDAASGLSQQADQLRRIIDGFIVKIRAA